MIYETYFILMPKNKYKSKPISVSAFQVTGWIFLMNIDISIELRSIQCDPQKTVPIDIWQYLLDFQKMWKQADFRSEADTFVRYINLSIVSPPLFHFPNPSFGKKEKYLNEVSRQMIFFRYLKCFYQKLFIHLNYNTSQKWKVTPMVC